TGASGGIGRATADALVKAGVRLALASRDANALNQLAETLTAAGSDVLVVPTDITKPDDRRRLVDAAVGRFGGLDLLVNNAGVGFEEGMRPEEVAAGIVDAVRRNRREVVLGREARRLLRFNRFFPRLTNWLIARKVRKLYGR